MCQQKPGIRCTRKTKKKVSNPPKGGGGVNTFFWEGGGVARGFFHTFWGGFKGGFDLIYHLCVALCRFFLCKGVEFESSYENAYLSAWGSREGVL